MALRISAFAAGFFAKAELPFDEEAFARLYARFGGVTWYLQAVLNRVWENPDGLTDEAVGEAIDTLVAESAPTYEDLLRSQTETAQRILKAIASEGRVQEVSAKAFVERHGLPSPSTIRSSVAELVDRNLLYRSPAGCEVYDRLFGQWLSQLSQ